ncbi:MAG TPA: hypothetical protein VM938_08900 [Acidimicrobiales bacterium]|nr:hypothetical protein [Acidimicrobiales bacterium]
MRNRIVALAAMSAFVVAVAGIAVVAARSGSSLERLPTLAAGAERSADMAAMSAPMGGGVDYVVEGTLPELPVEAPAFRLPDGDDRDAVERLARALGLDGEARKQGSVYTVKGATRYLNVETSAGRPWYLSSGCADAPVSSSPEDSVKAMGCASVPVTSCNSATSDSPEGATTSSASCSVASDAGAGSTPSSGGSSSVRPCPPCPPDADCGCGAPEPDPGAATPPTKAAPPPNPPADVPDKAGAERIARDVFGRLGVPLDTLRVEGGGWSWQATVSPSVGGLPVLGFGHSITIGPKGEVVGGNGFLASPRAIGDYPLVGVQGGLDRLRRGPAVGPMPLYDDRHPAGATHVVTLTAVHLALQQVGEVLVPVYAFEVKGGGELPVPAVTDRYLEQPRPKEGRPEPEPGPTGSSGSCSGSASGVGAGQEPANQPLTVDVCVEPDRVKVGQPVTFKVTATDPDAKIVDQCGNPSVFFGVPTPQEDCGIACTMSLPLHPEKTPKERGELTKVYTHTYDKPGTYTAKFTFQSGACNHWSSQGEGTATVIVVG